MEKLIELLNQFEEEKKSDNRWCLSFIDNDLVGLGNIREARLAVISKEYLFIKWLVDNDKIYLGDIALKVYNLDLSVRKHTYTEYPIYESLLMLLSIQDNPIEFLCSVLK